LPKTITIIFFFFSNDEFCNALKQRKSCENDAATSLAVARLPRRLLVQRRQSTLVASSKNAHEALFAVLSQSHFAASRELQRGCTNLPLSVRKE
jgi:hypothetical protein